MAPSFMSEDDKRFLAAEFTPNLVMLYASVDSGWWICKCWSKDIEYTKTGDLKLTNYLKITKTNLDDFCTVKMDFNSTYKLH